MHMRGWFSVMSSQQGRLCRRGWPKTPFLYRQALILNGWLLIQVLAKIVIPRAQLHLLREVLAIYKITWLVTLVEAWAQSRMSAWTTPMKTIAFWIHTLLLH